MSIISKYELMKRALKLNHRCSGHALFVDCFKLFLEKKFICNSPEMHPSDKTFFAPSLLSFIPPKLPRPHTIFMEREAMKRQQLPPPPRGEFIWGKYCATPDQQVQGNIF